MIPQQLRWRAIFVAFALVGLSSFWLPAPLPVDAPPDKFSAARALVDISAIAKAPHPTGSAENTRMRGYLFQRMRDLGLNPREMPGTPNGVPVVNLYGELKGTVEGNPPILIMAHFDSTPRGPGAADDSTGVAVALETIRALTNRGALLNPIGVLFTDGEEVHGVCLGAYLFVHEQTNLLKDLRVIVNMEARGNHGPALMFQTGANNNGLIGLFAAACPLPVAASFSEDVYRRMPNDTDLTEFLKVGKHGLNFAFTGGIEFYHTAEDTPANLSKRTVQHYGECVFPVVRKLARADQAMLQGTSERGDATFFTLCRGVFVHYPAWIARLLIFAAVGLFLCAVAVCFRRGLLRVRFTLVSVGLTLANAIAGAAIGLAIVFALKMAFKPRTFGPFVVGVHWSILWLAAALVAGAAITIWTRSRFLRRANAFEQLAGSIAVWIALMLVVNDRLAGASYLFMWPAFFGTLALFHRPTKSLESTRAMLLTAACAPLVLAPTIVLLHQTITIGITPLSAALLALAISLEPIQTARTEP